MGEVIQASITRVETEFDGDNLGHKFWLSIVIRKAGECQLRWYEKTNIPYIDNTARYDPVLRIQLGRRGMPKNQWWDMYKNIPDSGIFAPWANAVARNRDQTAFHIIDIPATRVTAGEPKERSLAFRIIVAAENSERVCEARQELAWDGQKITKQNFVIIHDNVASPSPGLL